MHAIAHPHRVCFYKPYLTFSSMRDMLDQCIGKGDSTDHAYFLPNKSVSTSITLERKHIRVSLSYIFGPTDVFTGSQLQHASAGVVEHREASIESGHRDTYGLKMCEFVGK